jgi:hypothetical protein
MLADNDIEQRAFKLIDSFVGRLSDEDINNARDLVSHREWKVGLELLCAQLGEYEIEMADIERRLLIELSSELKVNITDFGL